MFFIGWCVFFLTSNQCIHIRQIHKPRYTRNGAARITLQVIREFLFEDQTVRINNSYTVIYCLTKATELYRVTLKKMFQLGLTNITDIFYPSAQRALILFRGTKFLTFLMQQSRQLSFELNLVKLLFAYTKAHRSSF